MSRARRWGRAGLVIGLALAMVWIWPQAKADIQGYEIMGSAEGMFLTSLPMSLVTWAAWLMPATALLGPDGNMIPPWVYYPWLLFTPPLNWGLFGWLLGRWRDRRVAARDA